MIKTFYDNKEKTLMGHFKEKLFFFLVFIKSEQKKIV